MLTAAAVMLHGYHPFAEDAEIYLPGVEKILHPQLFPAWQEFFRSHARMTLFPNLVAFSLRATHLPFGWGLLLWHAASIFLLLLACWKLSGLFFSSVRARWGGVCLVAALLTIPVAGTALYLADQYLNPRNLAAFAGVFALTQTLQKKYALAFAWLVFAACVHPLMWVFPFCFCVLVAIMQWMDGPWTRAAFASLLLWIPFAPPSSQAYHEAAKHHAYHYIQHWEWYELVGAVAPLFLFWWFARVARGRQWPNVERVSKAFVVYGTIFLLSAVVVDLPARFEALARLQPMRSLHFLYLVMFVLIGGFLGEFVLRHRVWRWLLLFVPLCAGMFLAQRALFPVTAHLEWPWATPANPWEQAFVWARENTPVDAVFALDPDFMRIDDQIGFRCLAERSRLADDVKDNGVVSMFPPLAEQWWAQVRAQQPWKTLGVEDFRMLRAKYGATWVVLQQPGISGLDCGYDNSAVRVCRIP